MPVGGGTAVAVVGGGTGGMTALAVAVGVPFFTSTVFDAVFFGVGVGSGAAAIEGVGTGATTAFSIFSVFSGDLAGSIDTDSVGAGALAEALGPLLVDA